LGLNTQLFVAYNFQSLCQESFFFRYVTRLVNDRYNTACFAQEGNLTFDVILISETILPNLLQLLGQLPRHPRTPGRSWRQKPHGNIASCHRSVASISGNMLLVQRPQEQLAADFGYNPLICVLTESQLAINWGLDGMG